LRRFAGNFPRQKRQKRTSPSRWIPRSGIPPRGGPLENHPPEKGRKDESFDHASERTRIDLAKFDIPLNWELKSIFERTSVAIHLSRARIPHSACVKFIANKGRGGLKGIVPSVACTLRSDLARCSAKRPRNVGLAAALAAAFPVSVRCKGAEGLKNKSRPAVTTTSTTTTRIISLAPCIPPASPRAHPTIQYRRMQSVSSRGDARACNFVRARSRIDGSYGSRARRNPPDCAAARRALLPFFLLLLPPLPPPLSLSLSLSIAPPSLPRAGNFYDRVTIFNSDEKAKRTLLPLSLSLSLSLSLLAPLCGLQLRRVRGVSSRFE